MVLSLEKCSVPTNILGMIFELGTGITRKKKISTCANGEIFFIFQNVLFHCKWNETMKIRNLELDKRQNRGEKCVFLVHTSSRTQLAWSSCSGNFLSTKMSISLNDVEAKVVQGVIAQRMMCILEAFRQVSTKIVFSGPR